MRSVERFWSPPPRYLMAEASIHHSEWAATDKTHNADTTAKQVVCLIRT